MKATAVSSVVRETESGIRIDFVGGEICSSVSDRRFIRRWPAIILATSRMERVSGRMSLLVSSIRTMKFISGVGLPCGTR